MVRDNPMRSRSGQRIRFVLGLLQMFGAVFALAALYQTGLSVLTLTVVCVTGILTGISVLLFGRSSPRWMKRGTRRS